MSQSTDDIQVPKGLFALFKGDNGSGKSDAAYSFPIPYVFDIDRKMPAIALKHFPKKKIDWDTFDDIFQIEDKVKDLKEKCPYETLIVDTVTSASYCSIKTIDDVKGQNIFTMLKNLKVKDVAPSNARRLSGADAAPSKQIKTIELRGYDYYNGEDSFLKWLIDELKILWARAENPKHIIICAHVLVSEQHGPPGSTVVTETRRIVTAGNKIAAYIPAQFDEVYHFFTDQGDAFDRTKPVHHWCSTQGIGNDFAKTAYKLPGAFDFTDKSLYDLISDHVDIGRKKTL